MNTDKIIGIMGAMPEEIEGILTLMNNRQEIVIANRIFHSGNINNQKVVVVFSKWGKVAAALTASILINEFKVTQIIFTGVAGAIQEEIKIGDIVIGRKLYQHDMDARPLLPQFEIPLLNTQYLESDETLLQSTQTLLLPIFESETYQTKIKDKLVTFFGNQNPSLIIGDIASGDHFFSTKESKLLLSKKLPDVKCVEMEGAAVAQVCHEFNIPFLVIRIISDALNENTTIDFQDFVENIASTYSALILKKIIE